MSRRNKTPAPQHRAGGHVWPTTEAADRCRALEFCEAARAISGLELHPRLKLSDAGVPYTADFSYLDTDGALVFEDFNTGRDPRLKDIVRLWAAYGPGVLILTRPSRQVPGATETTRRIVPSNEREYRP